MSRSLTLAMRATSLGFVSIILLAACSPGSSHGQNLQGGFAAPTRHAPANAGEMRMSFAPVVKKAAPAVVNVYARGVVRQQVDPFWEMFGLGVPRERAVQSLGSGAIVRSDGVIVTNNHVISGAQEVMVALADRRQFPAKVLLADARADVAVLKIDVGSEHLPVLALDTSDDVEVGDLVLAIGDPFGVGQTVTNGIVSALARTGPDDNGVFIQTDAAINPGNSGGPLVDMDGDMIGLNSQILSRSGTSTGVGFAIPAAVIKRAVQTAAGGGHSLVQAWLGVKGQEVTSDIAASLGLNRPQGVLVGDVYPGSAADRAGIQTGDVILAVDGQPVDDQASLDYRISAHERGDQVRLDVRHGSAQRSLTARVEPAPATPAKDQRVIAGRNPLSGATVVNLSPAVAQELGVDPFAARSGVLVTDTSGQGYVREAGVRPGDFIVSVNGRQIQRTADLQAALAASQGAWTIAVRRNGQLITGRFQL
jgi:Do/DeqQ family serine protease